MKAMNTADCLYEFFSDTTNTKIEDLNPKLIDDLALTIPHLDLHCIYEVLLHMSRYEVPRGTRSEQQMKLGNAVDQYCQLTLPNNSFRDQIVVLDLYYRCGIFKSNLFKSILIAQSHHIAEWSPEEVVQYLFLSNLIREIPVRTVECVESVLSDILASLDIAEAAIVSYSLYKCKVNIVSVSLWERFMSLVENSIRSDEPVEERYISAFAKLLRGYGQVPITGRVGIVKRFLDILSNVDSQSWSLESQVRVASVGTQVKLCNAKVVYNAFLTLMAELDTCRPKYISTMLFTYAYFNLHITADQGKRLIERVLNPIDDYRRYYFLVLCTWSLTMMGFYDKRLYMNSFDPHKLRSEDLRGLDYCLAVIWDSYRIEAPSIHKLVNVEPTLIDKYRMKTKQDHLRVTSRLQERLAKEIYAIVTEQLEHEAKIGCFMPMYVEQDVKVGDKIILVCHGLTSYYNDQYLSGGPAHRVRLLRASGYNVVEIPYKFHTSGLQLNQKTSLIKQYLRPLLSLNKSNRFTKQRTIRPGITGEDLM
ncbi:uncharacterized protein LOC111245973 [Varroa destructor]|uniref:RAP domain-containing protein n=1 Tax=Varroa destructor TaxID=109461 RepID=A0A7M7JT80_VARDE|nr:uncharacterized protein LOC111245973 [Varroa destructor]